MLRKIETNLTPKQLHEAPDLQLVFLRLNEMCNATCSFCEDWKHKFDVHKDLDMKKLIVDIKGLYPGEINIHGGEAFLSKSFWEILDANDGEKIPLSITTNGSFFNEKNIQRLANGNIKRLYISIDHYDPVKNAQSRGVKWLESNLFPAVRRIKELSGGPQIVFNHVVTNQNISGIKDFIITAKELSVDAINLIPVKDYPEFYVSIDQILEFYRTVDALILRGNINKKFFLNGIYRIFGELPNWEESSRGYYNFPQKKACSVPSAVAFVDCVTGDVYPCDTTRLRRNASQYVMGNVLVSPLSEIWPSDRFNEFRMHMYPKITCECIHGCDPANIISRP